MFRRFVFAGVALASLAFAVPAPGQTDSTPDLAKFVPGKWMSPDGKAGVELESVKGGAVIGKWLDNDGRVFPLGATWVRRKVAFGSFEKGVFYMVTPPGDKWELRLSPDGSTLSGTRQFVSTFQSGVTEITLKRN